MLRSRRRLFTDLGALVDPGPLRLSRNENPVGPSPRVLDAMKDALPRAGRYPDKAPISESVMSAAIAKQWNAAAGTVVGSARAEPKSETKSLSSE